METLSKAKTKHFASLSTKKYRQRYRQFCLLGDKLVAEALAADWHIEAIVVRTDRVADWQGRTSHPMYQTDESSFRQLSDQRQPEGVLAVLSFPQDHDWQPKELPNLPKGPGYLLADLQDPGNMGTIIRTADWLGFPSVVCSKGCVDVLNPKVLRSSMGSFFRVQVHYVSSLLPLLSSHASTIWATDMSGTSLSDAPIKRDDWLLIGNEANGLPLILRLSPSCNGSISQVAEGQNHSMRLSQPPFAAGT